MEATQQSKKFYLFTERGITDRYFCGNIYEALPTDEIRFNGNSEDFAYLERQGCCYSFSTRKEANDYSRNEVDRMDSDNQYAQRVMTMEQIYGMEGVDF